MRRLSVLLLVVLASALAVGCAPKEKEVITMRFNHTLPVGTNHDIYANKWADLVRERTDGQIDITVYPASQLGAGAQQIEAAGLGAIDIAWGDTSQMGFIEPKIEMLTLPFMYADFDELATIFDGPIGAEMNQACIEKGNVRNLAYWWIGPRQMFTKVLLEGLDDTSGIKVRSPEIAMYINTFKTLDMNPTPIPWAELFTALQSGVVDAGCCNYENIVVQQFYSICPYVWQSNHIWQVGGPIINEDLYQSLDEDLQRILVETAQEIAVEQRAAYIAGEQTYVEQLKAAGATISPLETFKDMDIVYDRFKNGFWKETAERLGAQDMLADMLAALGK